MGKIYGIDLGTTNSLIGYRESFLSDLIPSIVTIDAKKAGESERNNHEAVRSFKVDMNLSFEGTMAIVASRYVLEELCRQVKDDTPTDVVISVPAYFKDTQRQATQKAAEMCGLSVHALINEPTAAAMYLCRNSKKLMVVFDLGGGTFDVSVVDSRFGNYDVQATDGLLVGGDDFDNAIFRHIVKGSGIKLHHLDRQQVLQLQLLCTSSKIQMQKLRQDFMIDLSAWGAGAFMFTEEAYIALMKLTFARTISKTRDVIAATIPMGEVFEIALVGGSTRCPYLRDWIAREIGVVPIALTYDPDKVVAQGAAYYAELLEEGRIEQMVSDVTHALSIGLSDGTVRTVISSNSKLPAHESTVATNDRDATQLQLNIYQGDSKLAAKNELIGTLIYKYGELRNAYDGTVFITISVDMSGMVSVLCQEPAGASMFVQLERPE